MDSDIPGAKESAPQAAIQEFDEQTFAIVDESKGSGVTSETPITLPSVPICITQKSGSQNPNLGPTKITLGLYLQMTRWMPGSVIKWTAPKTGYDSEEDAEHAASHLGLAAKKWNDAEVGVTFEQVTQPEDANFLLVHGGDAGDALASSFCPNADYLNFVYVYSKAFHESWKPVLWKVLTHELGHVLGLRHEFAMDPGIRFEGSAVLFGERNELSVMNYRLEPPEIQKSDIEFTRAFYNLPVGSMLLGVVITDYTPR
jgi:hypothetical protein